ncbi:MAG: hypothetical protein M0R80_08840 [Proteobacteria bacterium]|jgi:predicted protein tyrosine phosphatase|nr:hypothetical protein [Pseudomonadota bacterium]
MISCDENECEYFGQPTNGKLLVLPKSAASNFTYDKPWACISIGCEPGDWPKINKCQQVDLLQIAFADLDRPLNQEESTDYAESHKSHKLNPILFTPEHAQQIWDFVEKNWDKVELLMVHCLAGASRSPAVAAAIALKKYENDNLYFQLYCPNRLVYRTLLETTGLSLKPHPVVKIANKELF